MKTIKEVYEEFKSKDNASIHIDLLEQIRNQTEYNFYRGVDIPQGYVSNDYNEIIE
ncbi:hypothetical protein ZPAH1_orf00403 [Aeromonas phage ZPAH1]|nr:hypothetical protein ZPAH1_orf00403 [Aeromonas phage ZPAH1]